MGAKWGPKRIINEGKEYIESHVEWQWCVYIYNLKLCKYYLIWLFNDLKLDNKDGEENNIGFFYSCDGYSELIDICCWTDLSKPTLEILIMIF